MHEIDGISIGDVGYDRVCLNCIHWRVKTQLVGAARGVECSMGQGLTNPTDSCAMFSQYRSADSMQNQNRSHDKARKMLVWKCGTFFIAVQCSFEKYGWDCLGHNLNITCFQILNHVL